VPALAPVVFYAFAFDGAPVEPGQRGWFVAPATSHLLAPRARTALGRAAGSLIEIFRCRGAVGVGGAVRCDSARLLHVGEVAHELRWFALYCARSVANRWTPPHLVHEYLRTGDPELRAVAFDRARGAFAVSSDLARLAARVTIFATADADPALCAREACRLASRIARLDAPESLAHVKDHQERALASTLLARADARARTGEEPPYEPLAGAEGSDSSELPTYAA